MKEHPIIFTGESVRAILAGRKTQTRRIVKLEDNDRQGRYVDRGKLLHPLSGPVSNPWGFVPPELADSPEKLEGVPVRLWAKETFVLESTAEYQSLAILPTDRPVQKIESIEDGTYHLIPHYRASEPEPHIVSDNNLDAGDDRTRWKPAIFMPRWASRLLLGVVSVRAERIQDISEEDAIAEGVERERATDGYLNSLYSGYWRGATHPVKGTPKVFPSAKQAFASRWDEINAKRGSWKSNCWVWAITFTVAR